MSTCLLLLLLLLLCPPKYDYYNFFREIIVFTEKSWNTYVEKKNFYPPISHHHVAYCLLSPPPPLLLLCRLRIYASLNKNLPFSALQKHGNIFLSRILTSNIYALSLNPQKKKSTWTTRKKKKRCLLMKKLLSADVWNKKKKVFSVKMTFKKLCGMKFFFALLSRNLVGRTKMSFKKSYGYQRSLYGKKTTLKKTNNIHLLLLLTPLHTWKKEKKSRTKKAIFPKNCL